MERNTVESLETEVQFYRHQLRRRWEKLLKVPSLRPTALVSQNQTVVEREIRALIADNQKLSQQVGALLKEKLENARNGQDCNMDKEKEEYIKQVSLLTKERESLHVLWQTSQKTIDALETELKTYQGYDGGGYQNSAEEKRELALKLESALTDYIEIENKYKDLTSKHNALEIEQKIKEKEVATNKEKVKELENILKETTKNLEEYRINLAVEKQSNENLKSQLLIIQKDCVAQVSREAEAKAKVAEALQLYDVVATQKEEGYKKLAETTEELVRVKQTLANVRRETETLFRKETDVIKDRYNEKVADMLAHIRNLDAELVEKGLLLNKALREIKILQVANENYAKLQKESQMSVDPRLALAEQRMEAMFQELVGSERRNIQSVCEKQCLVMDMQRIQDLHSREMKRRNWEEKLLKTECEELRLQVEHLQKSLEETHGMVNKLQSILTSRAELNQKMVSTKEEELIELNKHLQNQMDLNKKWKESYVDMTEKLKKRLELLHKENEELKLKIQLPTIDSSNIEDDSRSS